MYSFAKDIMFSQYPQSRQCAILEVCTSVVGSGVAGILKHWRKNVILSLSFLWCFGLSCGFLFALYAEPYVYSWMYSRVVGSVSIVGLLVAHVFPLIFLIIVIRFRVTAVALPIALFKSFLMGFCQCCVYYAFGNAGWMVKSLFMFTGSVNSVLLLYFWILYIHQTGQWHLKAAIVFLSAAVSVCVLDFYFVAPYLFSLIV